MLGSLAALVVLLFAGHWVADFLADRWWAAALIPEAPGFLSGVHLLRLTLDVAAVLVATAWYAGHLLIVHRAIGSVQISRQVANLEIREAVTPATLLPLALGVGAALGVIAGLGAGEDWPVFALAWQGVTYGITDPYVHRDVGVFVAQLPLWVILHDFARLLAWTALGVVAMLYAALGAIRWQRGRAAMSDHARRHVGLLLAGGALVLAWGCLLDPFRVAAERAPTLAAWSAFDLSTLALAGASLAAAAVSVLWAFRGQHLLMVAAWGVLLGGAALVRVMGPDSAAPASDEVVAIRASMDRLAYGVDAVDDRVARHQPEQAAGVPSLWNFASIGRMVTTDSQVLEAAAQATVPVGRSALPVWLAVRAAPGKPATVLAVADGWTGAASGPLSFRQNDSLQYPGFVTYTTLAPSASRPGAPRLVVDSGSIGPAVGGPLRRFVLAWALQSARLLGPVSPTARVRWLLAPRSRLEHLAPFASWDAPRPLVHRGGLSWVAYGYLASTRFPGSSRVSEPTGDLGSLEAGLIGVVDAASGATALYLAPDAGPRSRSWSAITQGMIRPAAEIPPAIAGQLAYPLRLFEAQSRVLEQEPWRAGSLAGRTPDGQGAPAPPTSVWAGGPGFEVVAGYQSGEDRRVRTLLIGRTGEGGSRLTLVRLGEGGSLPGPSTAQATWDRFPSFEQIQDSVVRQGERFERGPWRILPRGEAPVAYQPWYAVAPTGRVTVPYVALAQGTQVGAGRSFADAWDNLRGTGAPLPPGFGPMTPIEEARRWMLRADSALHAGDWEAFGRAFGALRQSLGVGRPAP
ncbi:MAG TPA: UPF0182 family protein [Gemmatimonadales bacterium]|nr:UPF0182 family protein [Gemmatimonadales bacterium]